MYLNILEYIPVEKQDELMEMIDMNDIKSRGDFAKMKKEERKKGIEQGIEKTIPRLLTIMTPQQISKEYKIDLKKIIEIKNSCGK